jgi:hypothetical protein
MSHQRSKDIASIIEEGSAIDRAIVAARRRVIRHHRQVGVPHVIWRDGKVVEVPPDSVDLPVKDSENADDD